MPEDNRDFKEFELNETKDEDATDSVVSSTFGSCAGDGDDGSGLGDLDDNDFEETQDRTVENWETLDESERNATVGSSLKKLGNLKKKE